MNRRWYSLPYVVWAIIFTVIPLVVVVAYGVTVQEPDGSLTLSFVNFQKFFTPVYLTVFSWSVLYAAISTLV